MAMKVQQQHSKAHTKRLSNRWQSWQKELEEHCGDIETLRNASQAHHHCLRQLNGLRQDVRDLQRRLACMDLQTARGQIHESQIASQIAVRKWRQTLVHRKVRQLASAVGEARSCQSGTSEPLAQPSEQCLQDDHAWQSELQKSLADLQSLDRRHDDLRNVWAAEEGELKAALDLELAGLEADRSRLADVLLGFGQLRSKELEQQYLHAREMETLVERSATLHRQVRRVKKDEDGIMPRASPEEAVIVATPTAESDGPWDEAARHLRIESELLTGDLTAHVQIASPEGEVVEATLQLQIRELKEKLEECSHHRKRQLKKHAADLSLISQKLFVLDGVAEQLCRVGMGGG